MSCRAERVAKWVAGGLLSLCLGSPAVAQSTIALPDTVRVRTEKELRDDLFGSDYPPGSAREQLRVLWDGHVPLLTEVYASSNRRVREYAARGLSMIGSEEALEPVRAVLRDSLRDSRDVIEAAVALAYAGDAESIPDAQRVLNRIERGIERSDAGSREELTLLYLNKYFLLEAIARMERPDRNRPIIDLHGPLVEYRFLLEDIASIKLSSDLPVGLPEELCLNPVPWEVVLREDEFRDICDLLQDGEIVRWAYGGIDRFLIVELSDGRRSALSWHGEEFVPMEPKWTWMDEGLGVWSPPLASYLERHLPSHEAGGTDESAN